MSIFFMMLAGAFVDAMCAFFIYIKKAIDQAIANERMRRYMRSRRGYQRSSFKTRLRYKLEDIYDNIMTPK